MEDKYEAKLVIESDKSVAIEFTDWGHRVFSNIEIHLCNDITKEDIEDRFPILDMLKMYNTMEQSLRYEFIEYLIELDDDGMDMSELLNKDSSFVDTWLMNK